MRSRTQRLERLATEVKAIRQRDSRRMREPWPDEVRRGAVALMKAGYRAGEIAQHLGVPEQTLHSWRQQQGREQRRRKKVKQQRQATAWHPVEIRDEDSGMPSRADRGGDVRLSREIGGLSLAQVAAWLKSGVI
jgi:transposase-like protein